MQAFLISISMFSMCSYINTYYVPYLLLCVYNLQVKLSPADQLVSYSKVLNIVVVKREIYNAKLYFSKVLPFSMIKWPTNLFPCLPLTRSTLFFLFFFFFLKCKKGKWITGNWFWSMLVSDVSCRPMSNHNNLTILHIMYRIIHLHVA